MGTVIKTTLQTSSSDFNVSVYAVLQSLELDGTLTVRINRRNERKLQSNERQCEKGK